MYAVVFIFENKLASSPAQRIDFIFLGTLRIANQSKAA